MASVTREKTATANAWIGSAVERVEDERFLRGHGCYVADVYADDLLHACILRSPIAHGRIETIDTAAAKTLPGVVAVITAPEIGAVPRIPVRQHGVPEAELYRQPVIAVDKVRYVGEPVALVVAESAAAAEDAVAAIEANISELPVVADHHRAARDDILLFENAATNRVRVLCARAGDAEKAFAEADYRRRERFSVQRHTAFPMEPRGLMATWDAGRMVLYGAAKVPFFNRRTLAEMLGLAESAVDLIEVDVGGGFGARGEFYPEDFLIPFAARHVRGSVRWVEDRREHLLAMNHAREMYADVEIACRRDGKVLGLRGTVDIDLGAYVRTNGITPPRNVVQLMAGPYDVPNIALDAVVYATNKTPTAPIAVPAASKPVSSANGSSTWPRTILASIPPNSVGAISCAKSNCRIRCRQFWTWMTAAKPSATAVFMPSCWIAASMHSAGRKNQNSTDS